MSELSSTVARVISTPESLPIPRDQEEKVEFMDRFTTSARLKVMYPTISVFKKRSMAESAWQAAKMRSQVSIRNSEGEWLLF